MMLAVVHHKRSVGKTTLARQLATTLSLRGQRCLQIDADPQYRALDWSAIRPAPALWPVLGLPKAILHRDEPSLARDYETMVIDGPPRVVDTFRSALAVSEIALVPVQPSPLDVWAYAPMAALIKEAQVFNAGLRAFLVINRRIPRTAIGRDVWQALARFALPVLRARVGRRGSTAVGQDPSGTAAQDIAQPVRQLQEVWR
jgi:chromosome partitioning protein